MQPVAVLWVVMRLRLPMVWQIVENEQHDINTRLRADDVGGYAMTPIELLVLYLAFRAKQVICDYLLQTSWMATTKGSPFSLGGYKALAMHAGIHAAFTFMVVVLFVPSLWWLGFVDFIVHAAIDKFTAGITARNNWTYKDSRYWWTLGLDQEAHNITHLIYIIIMVTYSGGLCATL